MIKAKLKNDGVTTKVKGDLDTILNEFDAIVTNLHEAISENTNEAISKHLLEKAFKIGISCYEEGKKEGKDNE